MTAINDLTIGDCKTLLATFNTSSASGLTPFDIGEKYFIRTVTLYYTGRVKEIRGNFIRLENAAWIASTGRFSEALRESSFD